MGEHDVSGADEPASLTLVPLAPARRAPITRLTRPDPTFVAQLIATAAHLPQTRNLRRAHRRTLSPPIRRSRGHKPQLAVARAR